MSRTSEMTGLLRHVGREGAELRYDDPERFPPRRVCDTLRPSVAMAG